MSCPNHSDFLSSASFASDQRANANSQYRKIELQKDASTECGAHKHAQEEKLLELTGRNGRWAHQEILLAPADLLPPVWRRDDQRRAAAHKPLELLDNIGEELSVGPAFTLHRLARKLDCTVRPCQSNRWANPSFTQSEYWQAHSTE